MRMFVAVPVESILKQQLQTVVATLSQSGLSELRWLSSRNWHMTVLFLGDHFNDAQAELIAARIRQGLTALSAFEAPVDQIDWFPAQHPVVLAAVFERNLMLQALQDEVFQALKDIEGVKKPKNRFEPHISLARVPRKKFDFEKIGETPLPVALHDVWLPVEKVVLYRTHFEPEGVWYEVLAEGMLA